MKVSNSKMKKLEQAIQAIQSNQALLTRKIQILGASLQVLADAIGSSVGLVEIHNNKIAELVGVLQEMKKEETEEATNDG